VGNGVGIVVEMGVEVAVFVAVGVVVWVGIGVDEGAIVGADVGATLQPATKKTATRAGRMIRRGMGVPIEINGRGLPTSGSRGRPFLLSLDSFIR
jgi:hypothetical protein